MLEHHMAERAARLVRTLAEKLAAYGPRGATSEGFAAFCRENRLDGEGIPECPREVAARLAGSASPDELVPCLVREFTLLDRWIRVIRGPEYPLMLFGECRVMPFFPGEGGGVAVSRFLEDPVPLPVQVLLVDTRTELYRADSRVTGDPRHLRELLERYRNSTLWVLAFSR